MSVSSFHEVPDHEEERKTADKFILKSVLAKFRSNAVNILKILKMDSRFNWNNNGAVSIDGVLVRVA